MIKGSIVALITPTNEGGSADYTGLEKLIQFHLDKQTDGLLVLGTTGESSTLAQSEEEKILQLTVKKMAGRVPVIAGAGMNDTKETIKKAKHFASLDAGALLVIALYYNKTSGAGLTAHFTAITELLPIPLILYNVPSRTGMSIPVHILVNLAEHPNIIGLGEASGDMAYVMEAARLINERFSLYNGNDDLILSVMSAGGGGVISVWANIQPKIVHELVKDAMDGRWQQTKEKQLNALEPIHTLFSETNPIPIKAAMSLLNLPSGPLCLSLVSLSEEKRKQLAQLLLRGRTVEKWRSD